MAGRPVLGRAGRLEDPTGDGVDVDLVGTVVDAAEAGGAVHEAERRVVGEPGGAVDLHGPVDHVVQHAGADDLDRSDLDPGLLTPVDGGRGVQGQQSTGLDLGVGLEHVGLHQLLGRQRFAERLAGVEPGAHQLEGPLGLTQPAHAVEDPARAQALLGDDEAVAARTEEVRRRDADAGQAHLAVAAADAEHRCLADDLVAGSVGRHDDHRVRQVRRHVVVLGAAHHRRVGGLVGAGGEPLVAVDHPLVAVEHRSGAQLRRVRAGHLGFGHGEAGRHLGLNQPVQVGVTPLRRRVSVQHDRVLQRVGAERDLAVLAAPLDLVDVHVVHERQTATAELARVPERPQALGLGVGLKGADPFAQLPTR